MEEKIKQLKFKALLFLGLGLIAIILTNYLTGLHEEIIVLQNEDLFSHEIEPIDYYAHPVGDGEVDAGYIYSKEDKLIVDKTEEVLKAAENTKSAGIFISFGLLILALFFYDKYHRLKKEYGSNIGN
jgi:hypothetical protein